MTKKITIMALLVCSFMLCLAAIAITNLTGKWTANLNTPDGNEIPLTFNFKVDGDKLTGSSEAPQGSIPIADGKIDKNNFTFTVSFNGTDIKHTCKYYEAADSVGMDIDFGGQKMHTTLKRADK
jgi:uncharacterized lipoprotein YehR (DUF1307 family)